MKKPELVGDLVASWIPEWVKLEGPVCDCRSRRNLMNRAGADGVEANLESYVEHFLGQKKHLRPKLQAIPDAALRVWVRLVLRRACTVSRERLKK